MNAIHRTDRSVGMGDYRVRFRRVSRWVRDVSSAHALRPTQRVKCWATLCRRYGTSASRAMLSRHFRAGLSHSAASRLDPIAMGVLSETIESSKVSAKHASRLVRSAFRVAAVISSTNLGTRAIR